MRKYTGCKDITDTIDLVSRKSRLAEPQLLAKRLARGYALTLFSTAIKKYSKADFAIDLTWKSWYNKIIISDKSDFDGGKYYDGF